MTDVLVALAKQFEAFDPSDESLVDIKPDESYHGHTNLGEVSEEMKKAFMLERKMREHAHAHQQIAKGQALLNTFGDDRKKLNDLANWEFKRADDLADAVGLVLKLYAMDKFPTVEGAFAIGKDWCMYKQDLSSMGGGPQSILETLGVDLEGMSLENLEGINEHWGECEEVDEFFEGTEHENLSHDAKHIKYAEIKSKESNNDQ